MPKSKEQSNTPDHVCLILNSRVFWAIVTALSTMFLGIFSWGFIRYEQHLETSNGIQIKQAVYNNDLKHVKNTLDQYKTDVTAIKKSMATKDDLKLLSDSIEKTLKGATILKTVPVYGKKNGETNGKDRLKFD